MNMTWSNVLQALTLFLVLTGCSHEPKASSLVSAQKAFDELRATVRDEIKDPARSAEVVSVVDEMEKLMIEAAEARKAHDDSIRNMIKNYDASEEDFRSAFHEFNEKKVDRQNRLIAMDQRARSLTTAKEWKTIGKAGVRALKAGATAEQGM